MTDIGHKVVKAERFALRGPRGRIRAARDAPNAAGTADCWPSQADARP